MKIYPVTGHMIAVNEDRFVWYAIMAVLPFLKEMMIYYDTKSSDHTWDIINDEIINNQKIKAGLRDKIKLKQVNIAHPQELGNYRLEQVKATKTPWFLIVDADEIWPQQQLLKLLKLTTDYKSLGKNKLALVNRTRNCVGDVWHYLPESAGKYKFLNRTGHYNIRLMRALDYQIKGTYPNEGYYWKNKLINQQDDWLEYCDAWYLHTSHLRRSSLENKSVKRKQIYSLGLKMKSEQLPQILFKPQPINSPSPLMKRSTIYNFKALLADIYRSL